MKIESFHKFFDENPQFDCKEWLSIVRPCIDIDLIEVTHGIKETDSYFGGAPFLSEKFDITDAPKGNCYRFLGQFNLADIPKNHEYSKYLPLKGLLSFFYLDYGDDWDLNCNEPFWGDDGFIKAFYFKGFNDLMLHEDKDTLKIPKKIIFSEGISFPCSEYLNIKFPNEEKVNELYDLIWKTNEPNFDQDHLFGYPCFDTLGYDPTPNITNEIWIPLLNVKSHDSLEWCWHDGDKLMTFIKLSDLQKGSFDNIKSDAG